MKASEFVELTVVSVLVVVVIALIVGQALGQPILLSYVETGSMEPKLEPGDGFIAIPMAVAGDVESGDVVVFDAENLHGGGLVTHRVVRETDRGYITKGDANPVTDQDANEPPVQDAQIVAKAWQVGGELVVIPKIGLAVVLVNDVMQSVQQRLAATFNARQFLGTQGLAYILFILGSAAYLGSEIRARGQGRERTRTVTKESTGSDSGALLVGVLAIVTIMLVTASMTVPGGTTEFGVVSSSNDAPGPKIIKTGQTESFTYRVPSNGLLPVVVFLEPASDGIEVNPKQLYVPGNEVGETIVELSAPEQTGYYRRYLVEHRYIAVLPHDTIAMLYTIHPWMPILFIDLLIGIGFTGIGLALLGPRTTRSRIRNLPLSERIWRLLK